MTRNYLYTPELNLLAETELTSESTLIEWEYVWFGGQPLAQIEAATGAVHYYFNDHLGTPILTTDSTGAVDWRVEREPYGRVFSHRAGADRHQPLAFPGQEDPPGGELSYNIFRWYRSGWGRYVQSDPAGAGAYGYAGAGPQNSIDPLGLYEIRITGRGFPVSLPELDRLCRDSQGNVAGGACSPAFGVSVLCPCHCEGDSWHMNITAYVRYTSFVFDGNWTQLTRTRRPHSSVVDADSAFRHEDDFHFLPAARMLGNFLAQYEVSYSSEAECDAACGELRSLIDAEYRRWVRITQRIEESGNDPRSLGIRP